MIWSKHDFEREVLRQLVEIESIRKRVPSNPEVLERIGRLEESHKNLLRKLSEVFQPKSGSTSAPEPEDAPVPAPLRALERFLRTVEPTARAGAARPGGAMIGGAMTRGVGERQGTPASQEIPSLGHKCASCGTPLFSSVLSGEEVVFKGNAWHHRSCVGGGEGFSKPSLLN